MKLEELRTQFRNGGDVAVDRRTVADLLDLWLKNHFAKLKPMTRKTYRDQVERFIRPSLGPRVLREVRAEHVDAFLNAHHANGMSNQGRGYLRVVLGAVWAYGVRLDWIEKNVVQRSTTVPKTARQLISWSRDELDRFWAVAKGTTLETLFRFIIGTGCRIGEALGLRWSCVDFDSKRIHVRAQLQHIANERDIQNADVEHLVGSWYLTPPKTAKGKRVIEPGHLFDVLLEHRARQLVRPENRFNLVFTAVNGMPLSISNVRREYDRLIRLAGVQRIRLHDLRHTTATLLLEDSVAPHVVQQLLGHADVATTLRSYGHVTRRQTDEVADRLGTLATGGRL